MQLNTTQKRDLLAGLVVVVIGIGAIVGSTNYNFGSLWRMGPGLFPAMLGVLLVIVGALIAQQAVSRSSEEQGFDVESIELPDLRGGVLIILGAISFLIFGRYGGLVPATFACVFIAALGDRANGFLRSACLATGVTVFGALVFYYGLHIQLPLFRWGD